MKYHYSLDPLSLHFNPFLIDKRLSIRDLLYTSGFIRLWAFIHKYGERYVVTSSVENSIKPMRHPDNVGRCIFTARQYSDECNEIIDKNKNRPSYEYVEGFLTYSPFTLHAWCGARSPRHNNLLDFSREPKLISSDFSGYGVSFDKEFFYELRRIQEKNPSDILPYIRGYQRPNGMSCLTYRPLLEGKVKAYPLTGDDIDAALTTIGSIAQEYIQIHEQLKNIRS